MVIFLVGMTIFLFYGIYLGRNMYLLRVRVGISIFVMHSALRQRRFFMEQSVKRRVDSHLVGFMVLNSYILGSIVVGSTSVHGKIWIFNY